MLASNGQNEQSNWPNVAMFAELRRYVISCYVPNGDGEFIVFVVQK